MKRKRVLIIKLGYCETLVNEQGFVPSLGDVFCHTVLLHRYKHDQVTWLTSQSAVPLLRCNPYIHSLITYEDNREELFADQSFDEVVCFEKAPVICKMAQAIRARKHYGFVWNGREVQAHPLARSTMDIANGKERFLPMQSLLYQMVGAYWHGEEFILGYKPNPLPAYDIGLNFRVGGKWPSKVWPMTHWERLEKLCVRQGWRVSWQEGAKDLEYYMDWIHAGRIIVTCDSLGMHLGLAMKKYVAALFGPTPSSSHYMYGRGIIVRANWACLHSPCMKIHCDNTICMSEIAPEMIFRILSNVMTQKTTLTAPPQVKKKAAIAQVCQQAPLMSR